MNKSLIFPKVYPSINTKIPSFLLQKIMIDFPELSPFVAKTISELQNTKMCQTKNIFAFNQIEQSRILSYLIPMIENKYQKKKNSVLIISPKLISSWQIFSFLKKHSGDFLRGSFYSSQNFNINLRKSDYDFIAAPFNNAFDLLQKGFQPNFIVFDEISQLVTMKNYSHFYEWANKNKANILVVNSMRNQTINFFENEIKKSFSLIDFSDTKNKKFLLEKTTENKLNLLIKNILNSKNEKTGCFPKTLILVRKIQSLTSVVLELQKNGIGSIYLTNDIIDKLKIRFSNIYQREIVDIVVALDNPNGYYGNFEKIEVFEMTENQNKLYFSEFAINKTQIRFYYDKDDLKSESFNEIIFELENNE